MSISDCAHNNSFPLSLEHRLLESTAQVANALLTITPFDRAVQTALQIIGEVLETDRVNVIENFEHPSDLSFPYWRALDYEWNSPGTVPQFTDLNAAQGSYEEIQWLYELLQQGKAPSYLIEEAPEPFRSAQIAIEVKSTHIVPISVEGQWWGVLGIDDCYKAKHRTLAELSVLRIAADCIGSAIQRDRTQQAILKAEQSRVEELERHNVELQRHKRILEATARVTDALLKISPLDRAVNSALQIIGEALDTDRVAAIENYSPSFNPTDAEWKVLYEWTSSYATSQISHPELSQGTWEGIEEWYELLSQGRSISYLLEEMPEPFRSGQEKLGLKALHCVPIFVEGEYWGAIGFDDCRDLKCRTPTEFSVLKVAADCIGSAIQKERTQQALLQAEQSRSQELELHNTELQQTLDLLAESEHRYRTLFELSNEGIYRFEFEQPLSTSLPLEEQLDLALQYYRFAEANETFCAQMGISSDKLRGSTLRDFHGDLEANRQVNRSIIANGYQIRNAETDETDASGKRKHFLNNIVCNVRDGYVWDGWCTQTDITELRETQQALLQIEQVRSQALESHNTELQQALDLVSKSEERFRILFELSSDGFYYTKVDPPCPIDLPLEEQCDWLYQNIQVVEANPAFAAMYGVDDPKELIGLKNADFHVEGSEKNARFIRDTVENNYRFRNLETEERDRQGRQRYFLNNGVYIIKDGNAIGAWSTQIDVTELRETQQALLQVEQVRSAELEKANEELQQRDRLLSTVAAVSKDLLESAEVEDAIAQALQQIGEAAGISRMMLMQEKREVDSGRLQHCVIQEWAAPNVPKQIDDPATRNVTNDDYGVLIDELLAGRSIWCTIEDFPEPARSQQATIGVKSTGAVPIFIEGEYFGCVAFDDCVTHRQWTPAEIDVLTSGAGAIGAALHRQQLVDRLITERIHAERERSAELARANTLLRNTLRDLSTNPNLNDVLGQLLVEVVRYSGATVGHIFSYDADQNTINLTIRCQNEQHFFTPADDEPILFQSPISVEHTPIFSQLCEQPRLAVLNLEDFEGKMWQGVLEWFQTSGYQGTSTCVLMVGDRPLGLLAMAFPQPVVFSLVEEELVLALAQQIALVLQLTILGEADKHTAILNERNRMASEIHDTLAQVFTGISLQLQVAKSLIEQEPQTVRQILSYITQLAETGLNEARRSVWSIYPPAAEYANLAQLLYESVEQMTRNTAIAIEVNVTGTPTPLPSFMGLNLLRIGQEALTNALKHSQAQTISIELTYESNRILLTIRDDGRGFIPFTNIDNSNGGFGLIGMSERCDRIGADISLISQPDRGTQILIEAPLILENNHYPAIH
jgi:PAS domain S-box-containing protein